MHIVIICTHNINHIVNMNLVVFFSIKHTKKELSIYADSIFIIIADK